jgi:ATP-dependent RNA helicase DHX37/DHR1
MAPPPRHERYNAKARGSVAGGSSHKKRKRQPQRVVEEDDGSDTQQDPSSAAAIAMASEMNLQAGMSTKKRKRLESYIVSLGCHDLVHKADVVEQEVAARAARQEYSATSFSSSEVWDIDVAPFFGYSRPESRSTDISSRKVRRPRG